MAAADRRPQGQANEARPVPALEPGPRVRAWQELAKLHGRRKVPVKRREAGQEAVTGREQRGSGSGNGAASDPARPARRGAARRCGQSFPSQIKPEKYCIPCENKILLIVYMYYFQLYLQK